MDIKQIKSIDDLIPLQGNKKIISHKVSRLTAPGENYGSLMLAVDLTVKTTAGTEEKRVVAKTVPPNEFIQMVFNTPVTFRNEIGFYKTIVPVLQNFQKEHGVEKVIDFFPKYFGSRLNLTGEDKVDQDAALVLENLKVANYINLERTEGFDFDAAKLVIVNLAELHAVPLALKLQKPEIFKENVMPYMSRWGLDEKNLDNMKKELGLLVDEIDEFKALKDRILAGFDRQRVPREPKEPFATIAHNDCWTNNVMVRLEDGKPTKSKLVDFQICSYESPARDIIFFLFSSVKNDVVGKHYDDLLKLYHQTFISVLKELECDTAPFSFEALEKEIDIEARNTQFGHVEFMLFPIYLEKEKVYDIPELSPETIRSDEPASHLHKQKFTFLVNEFVKRNWL